MKISINPVTYRGCQGIFFEVKNMIGYPPSSLSWEISTETGHVVETGTQELEKDTWENWPIGEDNFYIERYITARLAITLADEKAK